jgi:hypothetical protein
VLLQIVLTYAILVPVWGLIFNTGPRAARTNDHPLGTQGIGRKVVRFLVSDVAYLLLYLTAGLIIYPLVRSFYATQTLPSLGTIVLLQLLLRGPVFVATCMLLGNMLGLPRMPGGIVVGVLFAIVSGVAPLLVPSNVFPDSVRLVHMCEIAISNLLFGILITWIWAAPGPVAHFASAATGAADS